MAFGFAFGITNRKFLRVFVFPEATQFALFFSTRISNANSAEDISGAGVGISVNKRFTAMLNQTITLQRSLDFGQGVNQKRSNVFAAGLIPLLIFAL
jgi:hypothetical protein